MTIEGNRKVIGAVVTTIIGVVITQVKGDIPPGLLSLLIAVFSGFVLGNVGEHITGAISARMNGPAPEASTEEEAAAIPAQENIADQKLVDIDQKLNVVMAGVDTTNQALTMIITKYNIGS